VTIRKNRKESTTRNLEKNEKINSFTIQVPSRLLWQWGILIIHLYSVAFSHKVGNLKKWL
jgi:hypothetical protein